MGPLLAGSIARGTAGFVTAPLELARVRMQAAQRAAPGVSGGQRFLRALAPPAGATPLQRLTFLWTGAPPVPRCMLIMLIPLCVESC